MSSRTSMRQSSQTTQGSSSRNEQQSSSTPYEHQRSTSRAACGVDVVRSIESYTDSSGVTWYGQKREFRNEPIDPYHSFGQVGHVFVGPATDSPPPSVRIEPTPRWRQLYDKRCELEVYCRWHGLMVPKARSADIYDPQNSTNHNEIIARLERENDQMQRRLDRLHAIDHAKIEHFDPDYAEIQILEDPLLVSDTELSDYSDLSDDASDTFIPSSLCVLGNPLCCFLYQP